MAAGTPVITTNTSSMPEVGGEAALYIEKGNIEQLVYYIDLLLESDTERKNMIDMGLEQCKKFNWENTAIETEKYMKSAENKYIVKFRSKILI